MNLTFMGFAWQFRAWFASPEGASLTAALVQATARLDFVQPGSFAGTHRPMGRHPAQCQPEPAAEQWMPQQEPEMAFPPAHQRAWPETSTVSAAVDYQDQAIRFGFGQENHPIERVQASPMTGVAMVGILSAVAIPAYQDYLERAEALSDQ